jgi:hypothetical protein
MGGVDISKVIKWTIVTLGARLGARHITGLHIQGGT